MDVNPLINQQKIHVDILGSCVLRDAFVISSILKDDYEVGRFVQNNPPTTSGFAKYSLIHGAAIPREAFSQSSACWFLWFELQSECKLYGYLAEQNAPYLICGIVESLYHFYYFDTPFGECRICESSAITQNKIDKKYQFPRKVNPMDYPIGEIEERVVMFCDELKKIYKEENIILVKYYPARYYLLKTANGFETKLFTGDAFYKKVVHWLDRLYAKWVQTLPNAAVVEIPPGQEADPEHKWGLGNQHFVREVYDMIGVGIDAAVKHNSMKRMSSTDDNKRTVD